MTRQMDFFFFFGSLYSYLAVVRVESAGARRHRGSVAAVKGTMT